MELLSSDTLNRKPFRGFASCKPMRLGWVMLGLIFLVNQAEARKRHMTIGESIEQAALIVIGDTYAIDDQDFIAIKKVLKGNRSLVNSALPLNDTAANNNNKITVTGHYDYPPIGAKNVAVLMAEGWQETSKYFRYVATFSELNKVNDLKKMVRIIGMDEAEKIKQLSKHALKDPLGYTSMQEQLVQTIETLQHAASFDLVLNHFKRALKVFAQQLQGEPTDEAIEDAESHMYDLMYAINEVADGRAVPAMVEALNAGSTAVRNDAAHALYYTYPGLPGVLEAFIKHRNQTGVQEYASKYLSERFAYVDLKPNKPHPEYLANMWVKAGKFEPARAYYRATLKSETTKFSAKLYAAQKLLKLANDLDLRLLVETLVPAMDLALTEPQSYIPYDELMVELLRDIKHPATLPPLLKALQLNNNNGRKAFIKAVYALKDSGVDTKQQAATVVLKAIRKKSKGYTYLNDDYLSWALALLWLSDDPQNKTLMGLFEPPVTEHLSGLMGVGQAADEVAYIIDSLTNIDALQPMVEQWVVMRLQALKDIRSIPLLLQLLTRTQDQHHLIQTALINMGQAHDTAVILPLFVDPKPAVRKAAINVYVKWVGDAVLPQLRKMMVDPEYGDLESMFVYLYHHGTPEELPYLQQRCNFWQADNNWHHRACNARAGIWKRHQYDHHGPIIKSPEQPPGL